MSHAPIDQSHRIHVSLPFSVPDYALREEIWKSHVPSEYKMVIREKGYLINYKYACAVFYAAHMSMIMQNLNGTSCLH